MQEMRDDECAGLESLIGDFLERHQRQSEEAEQ